MKFFTIIGLASAAKLTQKVAQREVPITDGAVGGFNPAADTTGGYEAGTTDGYEGAWVGTTGGQYDTGAAMQNEWEPYWDPEMQHFNPDWNQTGDFTGAGDDGMDHQELYITGNTGGADDACYDAAGDWNYMCDTTGGTDGASTGAAMQDDWSPEMQGNNWEDTTAGDYDAPEDINYWLDNSDQTGWDVTDDDGMDDNTATEQHYPASTGGNGVWESDNTAGTQAAHDFDYDTVYYTGYADGWKEANDMHHDGDNGDEWTEDNDDELAEGHEWAEGHEDEWTEGNEWTEVNGDHDEWTEGDHDEWTSGDHHGWAEGGDEWTEGDHDEWTGNDHDEWAEGHGDEWTEGNTGAGW